jgi:hypothetical protein
MCSNRVDWWVSKGPHDDATLVSHYLILCGLRNPWTDELNLCEECQGHESQGYDVGVGVLNS